MITREHDTIRELSTSELDQISGGVCQCGSDGGCVTQGSDGVLYTCGGLALFGGTPLPLQR
jgi:bacteriocin-like protein